MSNMDFAASRGPEPASDSPSEPSTRGRRRLERSLHRSAYLGIQLLRGRPVGRLMRQLTHWDELDAEQYARLASQRLESMLSYARDRVPLYRTGPWAGLSRGAGKLEHWPLLERSALIDDRKALIAEGMARVGLYTRRSSASTGTPVRVAWNPIAIAWSWAAEYHPMLWHGLELGARTLRMWGSAWPVENWVLNRHFVPAGDMTPDRLEEAVRYLETRRPDLVWGTPSAVHELARHLRRTRGGTGGPRAAYAKVGGEQLYAFQRDEIAQHLHARVIESYGCTEVGPIAAECPSGSMHVLATNVHLEVFRDGARVPAGEFGELVATTLVNRGMPLVRCRIGDMGRLSPEPCRCGLPQPVLAELQGRAADLVLKTDGTAVHGSVLGKALHRYAGEAPLGQAQKVLFEQLDRRTWKVKIESPKSEDAGALDRQIGNLLRQTFGTDCRAETEVVARIPREASGKFRYYRALRAHSGAVDTGSFAKGP